MVPNRHGAASDGYDDDDGDEPLTPGSVPEGPVSAVTQPRHWQPDPAEGEPLSGREGIRLLDELPVGIVLFDPDQNIRYANHPHRELLGTGIPECGGMEEWLRAGCRDDEYAGEVIRHWREHLWRKQLTKVFSLKNAEDHLREIELSPKLLDDGDLLLTIRDVTDSQQVEDALRLTEAKFRTVFQQVGSGVALIDRTGRFIDANPALERLLGHSRGELRRLGIGDCVALSDVERLVSLGKAIAEAAESSGNREEETEQGQVPDPTLLIRLRPREGELFPARVTLAPVSGPQGRALYTAILVEPGNDEADDDEEEQDARGRALLEAIPDLILVLDRRGWIRDVIPASGEWIGKNATRAWVGQSIIDSWPAFATGAAGRIAEAIDRGEVRSWRFSEASSADPEKVVSYEVRLAPCDENCAVALVSDTTEEAAARGALALQALAFRHLEEGIILTNLRGRVLDWNPAAERLFGYTLGEIRGEGLARLYAPPGEEAAFNAALSDALTTSGRWEVRGPYFRKDGSSGQAAVAFLPVEESGSPRSLVGIHRRVREADGELQAPVEPRAIVEPVPAAGGPIEGLLWRRQLNLIAGLLQLDEMEAGERPSPALKVRAWLHVLSRIPDLAGGETPDRVPLGACTRLVVGDLARFVAEQRLELPLPVEVQAEESLWAAPETAARFGLLLAELLLPALALPEQGHSRLWLREHDGHPLMLARIPTPAAAGISAPVLRRLTEALRGNLDLHHRDGIAECVFRFPVAP